MRLKQISSVNRLSHIVGLLSMSLAVLFVLATPIAALADVGLTQGFQSDQPLSVGSIVSLDKNSSNKVVAATNSTVDNLLGVVVNSDNSVITLSSDQKNQVQVATGGSVGVLVSNLGGNIRAGDPITASPIGGVGMKATSNIKVVGVAQGDLSQSPGKTTQTLTDKNGQKQTVQLGEVQVLVNVAYYFKQPEKTLIPSALQNIANSVAKKSVSPLPIIISMAIFIVTVISILSLVYSAIRSSIISVGRNPLSQAAVYRSLLQVVALVITILGASMASIYFILSKLS